MRSVYRFGTVMGMAAALCAVGMAQHPGRNAFLEVSAKSTSDLIQQVRTNPNIRDSYERHFQMTETELISYLRTLRPMRLQQEQVFTIYSVPPGGELKAHTQRLRKGELVFVDANGKPVLRARCGNPLVGAPPGVVPEETISETPPETREMEVPQAEMVPGIPLAMQPAPPIVPEEVVVTPPPVTPVVTAAQGIPIWPLLALPALGGTIHGGHNVDTPVPEPMTMLGLAAGAGALMARKRRKS